MKFSEKKGLVGIVLFTVAVIILVVSDVFDGSLRISDNKIELPHLSQGALMPSIVAFIVMLLGIYFLISSYSKYRELPSPRKEN